MACARGSDQFSLAGPAIGDTESLFAITALPPAVLRLRRRVTKKRVCRFWAVAGREIVDMMRMSWGTDWPLAVVLAAAAVMIAPLWLVETPAMPDYPAHLA